MTKLVTGSLRGKLIVFLLLAIVVPMSASILISYFYTRESLKQEFIRENSHTVYQGKVNLAEYLELMNHISLTVYSNLQERDSLYNIVADGRTTFETDKDLYSALNSISAAHKDIMQVYLHMKKNNDSYLIIDGFLKRSPGAPGPELEWPENKVDPLVEPPHPAGNYGMRGAPVAPKSRVLTLHRPIYKAPLKEMIGSVSIDFDLRSIANISDLLYTRGSEDIYLLNEDMTVVYASLPELVGSTLSDDWSNHLRQRSSPAGHFEWDSSDFRGITIYETVDVFGARWTLAKRIPNEALYHSAAQLFRINASVILLSLVVVLAATLYISFKLTLPIKQLIASVKMIKVRKMKLDIDATGTDEIGLLARAIKNMVGTIDHLITTEYRLELANKDNQLKALQAQINPHFIYNALQSIGSIALQNNVPRIYDLTSSLGKMMRYTMNTSESVVPLSKEIEHITAYLDLQKQRFKQHLIIHLEIDEHANDIQLPKMTLQPLVENYFKHGFEQQHGAGEMWIRVEKTDDAVTICVEDNGKGIEEERLREIRERLRTDRQLPGSNAGSIGLLNVLSRLQLYYHQDANIDIENREPRGLIVTLTIPIREEEHAA